MPPLLLAGFHTEYASIDFRGNVGVFCSRGYTHRVYKYSHGDAPDVMALAPYLTPHTP